MFSTKYQYVLMVGAALLIVVFGVVAAALPERANSVTVPEQTPVQVRLDQ
jgi:hypothetical protein